MGPKGTINNFLQSISRNNYKRAIDYMQLTFVFNHTEKESINWLQSLFVNGIRTYKVLDDVKRTDVNKSVFRTFNVIVNGEKRKVNVICEEAPYTPSHDGKWGVNPISVIKCKEYKK